MVTFLSAYVNSLRVTVDGQFSWVLSGVYLLVSWLATAIVVGNEGVVWIYRVDCSAIAGTREMRKCYIPLFLSKIIILALLSTLGLFLTYNLISFGILTLLSIYFLLLIVLRPYSSIFPNVTIIFC